MFWYNLNTEHSDLATLEIIKRQIIDSYHQTGRFDVNSSSQWVTYFLVKAIFAKKNDGKTYTLALARFRTSSHNLCIETDTQTGKLMNEPSDHVTWTKIKHNMWLEMRFWEVQVYELISENQSSYQLSVVLIPHIRFVIFPVQFFRKIIHKGNNFEIMNAHILVIVRCTNIYLWNSELTIFIVCMICPIYIIIN